MEQKCDTDGAITEFIEKASRQDYIQVTFIDINGVPRANVFPADAARELASEGASVEISIMALSIDGTTVSIADHERHLLGNITIRLLPTTLRSCPFLGQGATQARFCQVLSSAHWSDGSEIQADTRAMAARQVQRLDARGLYLLTGTETEFRLFPADADICDPELKGAHTSINMYLPQHYRQYEKFFVEMDRRMRSLGFKFTKFHTEYGWGQLEMPLRPEEALQAADNLIRFKLLAKGTAADAGYRCSFMTKPLPGQAGNGFHFNHSVWKRHASDRDENALLDERDPEKISGFARAWLAGLMHHGAALTALFSPTVNCYRRLHKTWAPGANDWAFDDRTVSVRVKNSGGANSTFIESRGPSSAANPYLVVAAVIAAGLDGVDRSLQPPAAHDKGLGELPRSLPEALQALERDSVLCAALGGQFVAWFVAVKQHEMKQLGLVNLQDETEADFRKEREMYFDLV